MESPASFRQMAGMMHNDIDIMWRTKEERIYYMAGAVLFEDIPALLPYLDKIISDNTDDKTLGDIWAKSSADYQFRDKKYLRGLLSDVRDRLAARLRAGK